MKVWITAYALTLGILEFEADTYRPDIIPDPSNTYYHGKYKHWHTSFKSAQNRAEQMKQYKIEKLKKQLAKIEKLDFSQAKQGVSS